MKRTLCAFCFAIMIFNCAACTSAAERYEDSISEMRSVLMEGSSGEVSAELISGRREQPFCIDGRAGESVSYSLVTVKLTDCVKDSVDIKLSANGSTYEGKAKRHPFEQSYSFEISDSISCDGAALSVSTDKGAVSITLKRVSEPGQMSAESALEIALEQMQGALSRYKSAGKFQGEIFIRYVKNPISEDKKYYWYVAFIPMEDCNKIIAALINPTTGELEARREE